MKPWVKGVRTSVQILVGAAIGGAVGIGIGMLAKMLSSGVFVPSDAYGSRATRGAA